MRKSQAKDSEMKIWKDLKPHLGSRISDRPEAIRALANAIHRVSYLPLPPEQMATTLALFSGMACAVLIDYANLLEQEGK